MRLSLFIFLSIYCLSSCQYSKDEVKEYLFLGHAYEWHAKQGNRIDQRLEAMDKSEFEQIWLGGDVCANTTKEVATLVYLDSLFDLDSPKLQWTLGNHDLKFGNVASITNRTKRDEFYTTTFDNLTLISLNTNLFQADYVENISDSLCARMQAQMDLVKAVTDTIAQSSHLIVLHHQNLLTNEMTNNEQNMQQVFNVYTPAYQLVCDSTHTFEQTILPMLEQVQKRGVNVICIGGDVGMRAKEFEYQMDGGIWFLGSGINNSMNFDWAPAYVTNFEADKVLILKNNLHKRRISWEFRVLGTHPDK